ncbi:MAG TPA: ribose 5-phosphate isomerase B [Paludibacteraceae bacterium]|nr:ribose 5-phosphate isomerase B [Paludibacteraceae bacterium]HOO24428.1 ribose 5-phosphate isomerase B [Paludibacteraceae bacterium]HOS36942.1 ribose 5-phosphate isomerase B [Paludibacteraceae bacterium]HPK19924.1 ribose 5-phosphate isomerase B [Paludibacteraceae bacterium]HPO48112.1 ribose 5-phosphate isomerase B [Paludibacteraceae bacterium]
MSLLSIGIASDHAGYELKQLIIKEMEQRTGCIYDYGTYSTDSCDYPDFAHPLAKAVEGGACDFGIAICGSGNGITMTMNKHQGIRAALCWDVEPAKMARCHNNANVLGLPARFISSELALQMVEKFLTTDFEGGRHQKRIDKIPIQEENSEK